MRFELADLRAFVAVAELASFRAAANVELAQAFLDHLRDRVDLPGRYADPGIAPATEPARVTDRLHQHATATLARLTWNPAEVARFLGAMLSEPKPDVYFDAPDAPLTARAFAAAIGRQGLRLDRRTQWLYDDDSMYVNGEARAWPRAGRASHAGRTAATHLRLAADGAGGLHGLEGRRLKPRARLTARASCARSGSPPA